MTSRTKLWSGRALAAGSGLTVAVVFAECLLWACGLPTFHKAHSAPRQFTFLKDNDSGQVFYVNVPSTTITFQYDSNPRGYFQPGNIVAHQTNSSGFRGPEFSPGKPRRTARLVFLGDSFTFGEGVHFHDTFAQATAEILAARFAGRNVVFESCNLAVGGYNTVDELFIFKKIGLRLHPDAVILCYVLNDAEPSLFEVDPLRGPLRRGREAEIAEGLDDPAPPDTLLYRLRTARLAWCAINNRARSRQTEAYYRALYRPDAKAWQEAQSALRELASVCEHEKVPLVVMLFPILHRLDAGHPFQDLYGAVMTAMEGRPALVLNLFPAFQGRSASDLWVHPTDQHPNEAAHRIAAEQLAEELAICPEFLKKVEECSHAP
ncbi:MAG: SGNH/GDSL hydrolase family protein [Thermoguttaceae bacterium]|jgi:hypothetical protein